MGQRIEWSEAGPRTLDLVTEPGEVMDGFGTTNEQPALVGPGFAIEGTLDEIHTMLVAAADRVDAARRAGGTTP